MPPVQITRAEYEKRFGVKPAVQTDVELDTTPAPVRITRAEYEAMFNPPEKTTGQNIKQDVQETEQSISDTFAEGSKLRSESRDRFMSGEISAPKAVYQQGGQLVGTGFGVAFEALKGAAKTLLPESVEKGTVNFLKGFMERGSDYNTKFVADTMTNGKPEEKKALQDILDTKKLYDTDPNFKADVDAAINISGLVTLPNTARNAVTKTLDGASDLIDTATPPAVKIVEDIKSRIVPSQEKRIASQADDILKVESKYQDGRNANIREGKAGEASRQRIAQSNVLEGAVDENGMIDTTEAVKIYRASTIDGDEGKVRDLLKDEGKTANLNEIRNELRAGVLESGLESAALTKAIKGIENHIKGLAIRADAFGNVPLYKLQDAKIAEYLGIDYKKPNTAKYKKTIARVYKEVIENKSGQDIKAINDELSKFYKDIERLERLNGKRVEGGRLGKYGAQVVGSVVGAAGGSVAGGAGAFVGGIVGGEVASTLKGKAMAKSFSRGIDGKSPDNSVLKNAKLKVDLKKPSEKIGIPAGIKATPEMKKVEAQISRNVELQKKAIKAGDFGLVAELKDIYENLVAKLANLIEDYKKNGIPLGMSIRKSVTPASVAKNMGPEDFDRLVDVIENPFVARNNPDTRRMLDNMGLVKATDDELVEFAKKATDAVDKLRAELKAKAKPKNTTPATPDPKNFKTAEEYVKAQGEPLYHGTASKIDEFIDSPIRPTFLTKDTQYADVYTYSKDKKGQRGSIVETYFQPKKTLDTATDKNALSLYNEKFIPYMKEFDENYSPLTQGESVPFTSADDFYRFVKTETRKGNIDYDAIVVDEGKVGGKALVPVSASKIKTRTQLIDEWKKATDDELVAFAKEVIDEADIAKNFEVKGTPKTVKVFIKSKFSDDGAMADIPVIKREDNITLYQGGSADGRQFWTPNKKYASQFGDVKEKTGSFYKVDNGNRVTDVYVEVPNKSGSLLEEAKKLSTDFGQTVSTTLANFIGKNAKTFNTQSSFKALDGMVRNQIDASLKMKPLFDDLVENRATGNKSWAQFVPLRELIDYPELFTAYPAAKNIRVSFMDMGKNDFGSFYLDDRGVPTINLNRSKKDATQTIKHEIQHFIQAKEGFSLGGNPDVLFRADVQNQVLKQQLRNVTRDKEIYQNATIGDMEYIKSAIEKTGRGEKLTTKEIEDFFGDEKEFNDLAMKTYKHLHGEWEAESNSIEELLKVKSPIFGKSKK